MYHIIKENDKNILLCSGKMREQDYIMVKEVFGIDKDEIRFVPQNQISSLFKKKVLSNELLQKVKQPH